MDGSTSARSPIIANPTPYVRPSFYTERGRTGAGVAPSVDASAACYRYLQSPAMPHNSGCTYPHLGNIYPNAIPAPSTSPFRVPASGMSNLRQFWPPTPPPDGFGRLGMSTSLYPMYPAITPLAPSSDSGIHGLIPRLGSSPSHYSHFFDTHKESSFLSPGLNIASPLTPTSSLATSTPLSSLPPSFDRHQSFPPMSLALKNMDLSKQQYCHENDDAQRTETFTDSICHHPITDQRRPGSANIEAHSKHEKIKGSATYHSYQESLVHNAKPKEGSKLLKCNDKNEKKHCNRSDEECSLVASNNLKSSDFQENLSESDSCKIKKSKNSQCSEYIDIVNISDIPRSYEEVSKSQTTDASSEKLRQNKCCLYPISTTAIVTSTPLTTSTSVTYSHQQFNTSGRIYSPIPDIQLKKENDENRHDCQFAKSSFGKTQLDKCIVDLCHCQSESGRRSHHIVHTGSCRVPKIPKTEPSQSSCCAQRHGNHQECLPLMYQPGIYESNNHSSQLNSKCTHTSLPQNDTEHLPPTWSFSHNSQNHLQLDIISKATSIPEQSGLNKEYKLPYPSEFLPDIQPLNYASTKSQQHDSKTTVQNSSHGDKVRTLSTSSADTYCPSTPGKKAPTPTLSSVNTCSTANSNIPVGIAIAQQRHSMSSAWKLGKLTDPHFPSAHNGSDGFPSLPNTSACHKNDNILRDQPYLSIKSIPTLPSNHSGLLVSPASKQWEPDTIPRTVLPHAWLRHGRVVAPGMWIGQGNYAPATPTASLPLGPLDSAQVSMPPVGYQLVRDSLTGHILLIPAVNIELVDGTQLWPKLDTSSALHRQSTQQIQRPRYYPIPPEDACREIELQTPLFGTQGSERQDDKLEQQETAHNTKDLDSDIQHNEKKLLTNDAKDDKIQTIKPSTTIQGGSVTSHKLENSSLCAQKYPSTSLQRYERHSTITLAQAPVAVQTEHAKRSQATSPLISVPITLHQPNKQKVNHESIINNKENQNSTSVIPNNVHDDSCNNRVSTIQINLEKEVDSCNTLDEKCKTVHSLINKTDEKCLNKNEVVEQNISPSAETLKVDKTEISNRKESPSAVPIECQSSASFMDHHGLKLLVDSIEELNCENLSKNANLIDNSKSSSKCNISPVSSDVPKPPIIKDKEWKTELEYSLFSSINTSTTDSLGILCALAEQRFIEETKSTSSDLKHTLLFNSKNLCDSFKSVDENALKQQINNNEDIALPSNDNAEQCKLSECPNIETCSEIESKEAEMRRRLAELQQKYKQKQRELACLQPGKNKKNNIGSQRCTRRSHSVRPYMYYRIRKEKLVSKSNTPHLVTSSSSSSDDHNTVMKRKKSTINRSSLSTKQGKKHKLEDLCNASEKHKKSKENKIQVIDVKSDNLSKKRIKRNLYSKRKLCKDETSLGNQHFTDEAEVISSQKYPESDRSKDFSTSGLHQGKETTATVKESINKEEIFLNDASRIHLCNKYYGKHTENSEQNHGFRNDNNENSAGYEGDTSDIEVPSAKRRKIGKPKKHSMFKYKENNEDAIIKQSLSLTKVDNFCIKKNQMNTETKLTKNDLPVHLDFDSQKQKNSVAIINQTGHSCSKESILKNSLHLNHKHNRKLSHCATKKCDLSKAKKKMKFKKSLEPSPKKVKNRECRKREKEEDISMTDELFAALKKCRLSETNVVGTSIADNGKEQLESSYSEGENVPLIALIDKSISEVKSCNLSLGDLHDKTRVLIKEEGLFYAGFLTAIQAPDVYGIILDGERGNKPRIYSREEILTAGILEVKPTHLRELPEGRRICAFWSQQYRCLYPGTVGKANTPEATLDKSSVFVEFDDGDSGSISIDDIRFLPQNCTDNESGSSVKLSGKRQKQYFSQAEQTISSDTSIKSNANIGVLQKRNKSTCLGKGGIAEENYRSKKSEVFPLQSSSETNDSINVTSSITVLPNKKKHNIKGNTSKKLKKNLNETRHSSSKKEFKKKRTDKCSENVSPKLKRHKKHKDDHKKNHRHNHHHHHHHRHHHHHKKHKHDKLKAQSVDQNQLLFSSDANMSKDIFKMSSTLPENGFYSSLSETEKDSAVKDFNLKLAGRKDQNKSSDDITQFLSNIKVTSDNIADVTDNTAIEPNSEPQLWSWCGKSFRRPGSKRKARKEYYKAIIRGKDILKVGDCAVYVSSGRPHLPYVGQIETMWQSWGGNMVVKVKWFYHPEEMKQNVDLSFTKGALFQSTHVDENDVQTISHKCELLTKAEYKRRMDLRRNTQCRVYGEDIYYLAGSYDPISGTVMPEIEYA